MRGYNYGVRVGKPLAPRTFAVYIVNELVELIYASSRESANRWAQNKYGNEAYIMENAQALDVTYEGY